jgi:hypothetical protein
MHYNPPLIPLRPNVFLKQTAARRRIALFFGSGSDHIKLEVGFKTIQPG